MLHSHRTVATALVFLLGAGEALSSPDSPVLLEVVAKGQHETSWPALVLKVQEQADHLAVQLACGGKRFSHASPAARGDRVSVDLEVPVGTWRCTGSLSARFANGDEGQMPLDFQVTQHPPLKIEAIRKAVDTENKQLQVVMDRTPALVEVVAYDERGQASGRGQVPVVGIGAGEPVTVEWAGGEGEVIRLHVKGQDLDGFWAALDLFPWHYQIPHEDVVFETNRAEIRPEEEAKLHPVLADAREVLERYRDAEIPMNLYVGGYTDTVGSRESNLTLSTRRARAIAEWFRANGFSHPIWYQGFGEEAPAVPTPDEVDEPANRRAVYVLAAEAPPPSPEFPSSAWRQLD